MTLLKKFYSLGDGSFRLDLDSLFREFYDRLVYFSFKIVQDKYQAQDIAQEAFIKYWNEKDSVSQNKVAIKNYLYSSVRNGSLNLVRHTRIVEGYARQQGAAEPEELPVIDAIITSEVLAEIHSAIDALPYSYKIICTKAYLEGKKNQEIADELGMSVNTVKKQKQKVLDLLRLKLTPEIFSAILLYCANT